MWKVQNDSIPTRVVNTNSLRKVFMFILTYDVGQKSLEDDRYMCTCHAAEDRDTDRQATATCQESGRWPAGIIIYNNRS